MASGSCTVNIVKNSGEQSKGRDNFMIITHCPFTYSLFEGGHRRHMISSGPEWRYPINGTAPASYYLIYCSITDKPGLDSFILRNIATDKRQEKCCPRRKTACNKLDLFKKALLTIAAKI